MKLLFICTHNRCRSILAEAIANHIGDGSLIAASAGSSPQGQVHPSSLNALQRHGIDIRNLRSKSWSEFEGFGADAIITLCDSAASEPCPVWFGQAVSVHWGLKDPSKSDNSQDFDETINTLCKRLKALKTMLGELDSELKLKNALNDLAQKFA